MNEHKNVRILINETASSTILTKNENVRLPSGVSRIFIHVVIIIIGTGMSTTISNFGDIWKIWFLISPSGAADAVNCPDIHLLAYKQRNAKALLIKETLSETEHRLEYIIALDPGIDLQEKHLGIDDGFEQLNVRLEFNTESAIAPSPSGTITSIQFTGSIDIHLDSEENDSVGYRQYIFDSFGVDTKDSNTKVHRLLQSNREIDAILLHKVPDFVKSVRILRGTNTVAYEAFIDVAKAITEQIFNVQGGHAIIDPIELIETGENCILEFELGNVTSPTTLEFLTEYLHYDKEEDDEAKN